MSNEDFEDFDDIDLEDDFDLEDDDDEYGDDEQPDNNDDDDNKNSILDKIKSSSLIIKIIGGVLAVALIGGIGYGGYSMLSGDSNEKPKDSNLIYSQTDIDKAYKDGQNDVKNEAQKKYQEDGDSLDKSSADIKKLQRENKSLKDRLDKQQKLYEKEKKDQATKEKSDQQKIESLQKQLRELKNKN